jgi:hypothetical protein
MNVSTRRELQILLDNIRVTQGTADGSSLAYRVAWFVLVCAPVLAILLLPYLREPFSGLPILLFLPFFVQALYSIIQYNVNRRLRPILEALLFVPEEPPIQAKTEVAPKKAIKARLKRRRK